MRQSIFVTRLVMLAFCLGGGYMAHTLFPDLAPQAWLAMLVAFLIGLLLILVDMLLKGFSLRALSGLTFGLLMGILASHLIIVSPLFEGGDPQVIYLSRLSVFVAVTYLATVISLRGKDEFNLVIPYVKFEPEKVEVPLLVLDTSCLVDGRVSKLCKARLLGDALVLPKFVLDELHELASMPEAEQKNRGKRGLRTLTELRQIDHVNLRTHDSDVEPSQSRDDKLLFVVSSLKGRLLATSESVIRRARAQGAPYVDLLALSKALTREVVVGETISVKIVKRGKEPDQGVGYLDDGSMVVVNEAADYVGSTALVEVESVIPTSGGRMVFGKLLGEDV